MSKEEHELKFPLTEEKIRQLKIGDAVYFSGTIITLRDMGHRRVVDLLEAGRYKEIPFAEELTNGALWHCAPIVSFVEEEKKWEVCSAGSTTSSRFTSLGAKLIDYFNIRITVGKGTMLKEIHKVLQNTGSCYLNSTGGCAALYAKQIKKVQTVHWLDLGYPEAAWVLEVDKLGPLIVGIDSNGNSLFEEMKERLQGNLSKIYKKHNLKKKYAYLPKRVPGSS